MKRMDGWMDRWVDKSAVWTLDGWRRIWEVALYITEAFHGRIAGGDKNTIPAGKADVRSPAVSPLINFPPNETLQTSTQTLAEFHCTTAWYVGDEASP